MAGCRRRHPSGGDAGGYEPPGVDAGEITDKGHISQRAGLERRAAHVRRMHPEPLDAAGIVPTGADNRSSTSNLGAKP